MGDAIFYSAMAWAITRDEQYASNIDHWISTWFINNATAMTPNCTYRQAWLFWE